MWQIYDDLINSIPDSLTVLDCVIGLHFTLVRSENGTGAAMTVKGGQNEDINSTIIGMPLKELAASVKSWNMITASLGLAAINSAFNNLNQAAALTGRTLEKSPDNAAENGFTRFLPAIKGKNVAVIGHFPHLDLLKEECNLSILERIPQDDDYPDPACEYILPQQDAVFITGSAFINKTMPRLLVLSKNAQTVVLGPSTPLSPVLFQYGIDAIGCTVITDENRAWQIVKQAGRMKTFKSIGQMVTVSS